MKITYWKHNATDPQWGLCDVTRTDQGVPLSNTNYSGSMGWCKITPFSILDPNSQITFILVCSKC